MTNENQIELLKAKIKQLKAQNAALRDNITVLLLEKEIEYVTRKNDQACRKIAEYT